MVPPRSWFREGGWLPQLMAPLAGLYGALVAWRHASYRSGRSRVEASPVPVIVVGNIFVGGTGKTPLVAWLVERLRAEGWHPGIVSRGYGGRAGDGPTFVAAASEAAEVGDEPLLLARRTGAPVCVGRNRPAAVAALHAQAGCDVVVSDDGLQHLRMGRAAEIVVIDAERGLGNGRLLPAGPLREPASRLERVDLVVANGGPTEQTAYAFHLCPGEPEALDGSQRPWPGGSCHVVAGIGNPGRFFRAAAEMGLDAYPHAFADHHTFRARDLAFGFGADWPILMTEKDAVKCRHLPQAERIWTLPTQVVTTPELEFAVSCLLARILTQGASAR